MLKVVWWIVLALNLLTLIVFGWDKWRSRRQGRRVPERTLLLLMFWFGWLGGWLAMAWFRHKTVKQSFRRLAILWTIVNPFWVLVWWTLAPTRG